MAEETQDGQKTLVAFVVGLLIGGMLVWAFSGPTPEPETPMVIIQKEEVGDGDKRDNYRFCYRASQIAQNPSFWDRELKEPFSAKESQEFINHCLANI